MDWSCLLSRTGLDLNPMDNQSVVCTHFAEQYLASKIDYCVWSKPYINNHSVKESFLFVTFSSYIYRHVYIHRCVYIPVYIYSYTPLWFVYVWMCRSTYLCMYSGMCLYFCIDVIVCNNTHIQTHTYKHNVFKLFHIS